MTAGLANICWEEEIRPLGPPFLLRATLRKEIASQIAAKAEEKLLWWSSALVHPIPDDLAPMDFGGLTVQQSPAFSVGGYVWPASLLLCAYLEEGMGKSRLENLEVLEVGAGCGLPGMLAAHSGAKVCLTDKPCMKIHLKRNTDLNTDAAPVKEVCGLELGSDIASRWPRGQFKLIMAADVTYQLEHCQAF